jgi:CHASE3 domain sensor protein
MGPEDRRVVLAEERVLLAERAVVLAERQKRLADEAVAASERASRWALWIFVGSVAAIVVTVVIVSVVFS